MVKGSTWKIRCGIIAGYLRNRESGGGTTGNPPRSGRSHHHRSSLRNKLVAFYLTGSIKKYGSGFTLLTPSEVEQKAARRTVGFLQIKVQEYERLRTEIEELKREAEQEIAPGNADE